MPNASVPTFNCYSNFNTLHPYVTWTEDAGWPAGNVVGGTVRVLKNDAYHYGVDLQPEFTFAAATTVTAATSATVFQASALSSTNDTYNGMTLQFMDGTLRGQKDTVLDYDGTLRQFTMTTGFSGTPTVGDVIKLYNPLKVHGFILGLDENTTYTVETTWTRTSPTGVVLETFTNTASYTTRSSTVPEPTGLSWYLDPTNGNDSYAGHNPTFVSGTTGPKKTMESIKTAGLAAGDVIYLVGTLDTIDGKEYVTFDLASANNYRLQNVSGTANAWIHIRPYNANTYIRGWKYLNGTWTDNLNGTYTLASQTDAFGVVIDTAWNNQELYPYGKNSGADDFASVPRQIGMNNHTWPGFYQDNVADTMTVRLASGTAPATNQLKGGYTIGLLIANVDYVKIQDLVFEYCVGSTNAVTTHSLNTAIYGLGFAIRSGQSVPAGVNNAIVTNCRFDHCAISVGSATANVDGSTNILIDQCDIVRYGPYQQFISPTATAIGGNDPYNQYISWQYTKNVVDYNFLNVTAWDGVVIRDCNIQGSGIQCDGADRAMGRFMDIYNNRIYDVVDDGLEFDNLAGVSMAVFNNSIEGAAASLSLSHYDCGPLLFTGNLCKDFAHTCIKVGGRSTTLQSNAMKMFYNNTFISTRASKQASPSCKFNGAHSGSIGYNNIFAGTGTLIFSGGGKPSYTQNIWNNNGFYKIPKLDVATQVLASGVTTGTPSTTTFTSSGASISGTDDNAYGWNSCVRMTSGAANGCVRPVANYVSATKNFQFNASFAFPVAPGVGDSFDVIVGDEVTTGAVTGSSSTTTSLVGTGSGLSSVDNAYKDFRIVFTSGAIDSDLSYRVSSYTGSTKTFTMADTLPSIPQAGNIFKVVTPSIWQWDSATTGYKNTSAGIESTYDNVIQTTSTVAGVTNLLRFTGQNALSSSDDTYNGLRLEFTSGTLNGEWDIVEDYIGSSRTFVMARGFSVAPTVSDAFKLVEDSLQLTNNYELYDPFQDIDDPSTLIDLFATSALPIHGITNIKADDGTREAERMGFYDGFAYRGGMMARISTSRNIPQGNAFINAPIGDSGASDGNFLQVTDINEKLGDRLRG